MYFETYQFLVKQFFLFCIYRTTTEASCSKEYVCFYVLSINIVRALWQRYDLFLLVRISLNVIKGRKPVLAIKIKFLTTCEYQRDQRAAQSWCTIFDSEL